MALDIETWPCVDHVFYPKLSVWKYGCGIYTNQSVLVYEMLEACTFFLSMFITCSARCSCTDTMSMDKVAWIQKSGIKYFNEIAKEYYKTIQGKHFLEISFFAEETISWYFMSTQWIVRNIGF